MLNLLSTSCTTKQKEFFVIESEGTKLKVETVTDSISIPFGMDFLPDGRLLVTDRAVGQMVLVNTETGTKEQLQDVPAVVGQGDGGLLDILVHPDYKNNGWIYFAYSEGDTTSNTMVVDRAKLNGLKLVQRERLFYCQTEHQHVQLRIGVAYTTIINTKIVSFKVTMKMHS